MDRITIIVPCYNEEEVIEMFYPAVQAHVEKISDCHFNYIFVNDGSRDATLDKLRKISAAHADVTYISLSRNFGKESAMMAGIDYADGDAVIIMDADLQHPPEKISEMIKFWREGYDDVCAKRVDRAGETWLKRSCANLFYAVMKKFSTSYEMQRDVGDFRLLDRRCIEALKLMRENQRFTKGLFTWVGYRKKEIPFEVQPAVQSGNEGHDFVHDRAAAIDDVHRNNNFARRNALHDFCFDDGTFVRRSGRGLPDADNRDVIPRRHSNFIAGDYRRIYRANLPRKQTTPNLSCRRD